MKENYGFQEFVDIIKRLRAEDGCPWDREQTHTSLKQCMLEEAYEVVEEIDNSNRTGNYKELCEELGDVLLQIVMHSQIASESGEFTINDVITTVSEKMVRRHPHVFGQVQAKNTEEVLRNWDQIKQDEKQETLVSESMLRIPKAMPALMRAEKVQKKAAKVGFDFISYEQALEKVHEELQELENARVSEPLERIMEEYGDLMFSVVNLSRFLKLNAENSLTNATDKFINRFVDVEKLTLEEGRHLKSMSIDELNALWGRVK